MSVSGFSESDSFSQTILWAAAVFMAFFGLSSIAAVLSSAFQGSSSEVLFVPAADAFLVGILGRGGNLEPFDVVWAKHALVLCPSLPHLLQSASFCLYSLASSSGVPCMAALQDSHRISCSGNLSLMLGPIPPVDTAGPFSFPLACTAFCSGVPFGAASFSFSFLGPAICFLAASAHASSSSSIPASRTAWSRSLSVSGIF